MQICNYRYMPRKETGEKLEKVVSTKISLEDFKLLKKYVKIVYNHSLLTQPTISHQIRYILKRWAYFRRKEELIRMSALQTPRP
jgi:hypothetical protein